MKFALSIAFACAFFSMSARSEDVDFRLAYRDTVEPKAITDDLRSCVMKLANNTLELLRLEEKYSVSDYNYRFYVMKPFSAPKYWTYLEDIKTKTKTTYSLNMRVRHSEYVDRDGNNKVSCFLEQGASYDMLYLFNDRTDQSILRITEWGMRDSSVVRLNNFRFDYRVLSQNDMRELQK